MYWLTKVGWGAAQTDRVCARGNRDAIARALCSQPRARLSSLDELLHAFWPNGRSFFKNYSAGLTNHSQALSARTVSALNPAVILSSLDEFAPGGDGARPGFATDLAISFTRGDQLVELLGLDVENRRLNFYLLAFGHACRAAGNCTATDVLGPRIERDWTSWTLYQDEDIEDTPLACLVCHQSEGPGMPKRVLIRQFAPPWLHWGQPSSATFELGCADRSRVLLSQVPRPDATAVIANLAGSFVQAHAGESHFAGVPIDTLLAQRSGEEVFNIARQMRAAILRRDGISTNRESDFPLEEPHKFNSIGVITEQYCPNPVIDTWNAYRNDVLLQRGLPIPHHQFDVIGTDAGVAARTDYAAFLQRAGSSDPLEILAPLMGDDVATAVGFYPSPDADAPAILRQMCGRCHTGMETPGTRRAAFDARNLERLNPLTMAAVMRRLRLAADDPELMPPRRAGEMPAWAIDRIGAYFATR
jgi:hypothetical protein